MLKKKKIIILVIVIAVIVVAIFVGAYAYQQDQQQRAIAAATANIDATSVSFNESQERTEKLKILQDTQKLYAEDSLAKNSADLNDKYSSALADFQIFFVNYYETVIKDNTIAVDTATKTDLEKCKSNLAACLNNIASEGAIVIATDGGKGYTDQINALITSYNAKIAEIVAAEEAAAKAEAERIAAEEAAKKANEESSKQQGDQATKSNAGKNSGNNSIASKDSGTGGEAASSGSSNSNTNGSNNSNNSASTEPPVPPKGPKPAKYTVIQADDFPRDGWSWRRSTFCWHVCMTEWGGADGRELVAVDWDVFPDSGKVVGAKENAEKFLPPKPTLEESKSMITYGEDVFYIRYGHTTLYVCLED